MGGDQRSIAQFWQIPVYEVKTRSLIYTDQRRRFRRSRSLPEPPDGLEQNSIKIIPDVGWVILTRLYAALEPILNKQWRLDDIESLGLKQ